MPHEREDAGLIAFEASPHAAAKSEITRLFSLTASGSLPDTATEGGSVEKSGMVGVTCQVRRRVKTDRCLPLLNLLSTHCHRTWVCLPFAPVPRPRDVVEGMHC
jgi:hypothetical protein